MRTTLKYLAAAACLGVVGVAQLAQAQLSPAGEGRRLWLSQNCYGCHGGRAGGGMGPNFRGDRPDSGDVTEVLTQGGDGMPSFPNLTSTDISNLTAYLQSLRTTSEPTFTHWWESVPTQ